MGAAAPSRTPINVGRQSFLTISSFTLVYDNSRIVGAEAGEELLRRLPYQIAL